MISGHRICPHKEMSLRVLATCGRANCRSCGKTVTMRDWINGLSHKETADSRCEQLRAILRSERDAKRSIQ